MLQFLINRIPPHTRYWELFAGSAKLFFAKKAAEMNCLNDINYFVWHRLDKLCGTRTCIVTSDHAADIIKKMPFTNEDFIYLDPPYPISTLGSNKLPYDFILHDADHIVLLDAIKSCKANIMISSYGNHIYDKALSNWSRETFTTIVHGQKRTEVIWYNYERPSVLHQYDFVGNGFTDRQRMKRKLERLRQKIAALPPIEQQMLGQIF